MTKFTDANLAEFQADAAAACTELGELSPTQAERDEAAAAEWVGRPAPDYAVKA